MRWPRVLLLTDRAQLPLGRSLMAAVAAAVAAGVDHVVLRELDLSDRERAGLAVEFLSVGATVIAAHRPLPGCVAVHLPAESAQTLHNSRRLDPSGAGARADSALVVGRSCHSAAEVRRAAAEGAVYATLGPFAATPSKPGYGPPVAPGEYAGLPIPTYALGGVDPGNAERAIAAGAHGVAVMGSVMRADDPGAAAAELLEVIG